MVALPGGHFWNYATVAPPGGQILKYAAVALQGGQIWNYAIVARKMPPVGWPFFQHCSNVHRKFRDHIVTLKGANDIIYKPKCRFKRALLLSVVQKKFSASPNCHSKKSKRYNLKNYKNIWESVGAVCLKKDKFCKSSLKIQRP